MCHSNVKTLIILKSYTIPRNAIIFIRIICIYIRLHAFIHVLGININTFRLIPLSLTESNLVDQIFFHVFFSETFPPFSPNVLSACTEASDFFFLRRILKTCLFSSSVLRLVRFDLSRTNNVRFSSSGFVFVFYNWPLSLIVIEIDLETLHCFHLFLPF